MSPLGLFLSLMQRPSMPERSLENILKNSSLFISVSLCLCCRSTETQFTRLSSHTKCSRSDAGTAKMVSFLFFFLMEAVGLVNITGKLYNGKKADDNKTKTLFLLKSLTNLKFSNIIKCSLSKWWVLCCMISIIFTQINVQNCKTQPCKVKGRGPSFKSKHEKIPSPLICFDFSIFVQTHRDERRWAANSRRQTLI